MVLYAYDTFMKKIREKIQKFMYNKYGADQFGMALVIASLIVSVIATIANQPVLSIISWAMLIYALFRMFSKNYVKRRIENDTYMQAITYCKRRWKVLKNNVTDRQYHYYLCPKCHQVVRVPRGKGKITITCPSCRNTFDKRS